MTDFDKTQRCPHCHEPMQVRLPIWITPGDDMIDVANVDYESNMPDDSDNWWCEKCQSHHFPEDSLDATAYKCYEEDTQ